MLKDKALLRQACLIDGQWVAADGGGTVAVDNPATGESLGVVPKCGRAETARAIAAANRAWPLWRAKTALERADLLLRWHDLIDPNRKKHPAKRPQQGPRQQEWPKEERASAPCAAGPGL